MLHKKAYTKVNLLKVFGNSRKGAVKKKAKKCNPFYEREVKRMLDIKSEQK